MVAAPALFDKSIEERETQAAESWRIHPVHASALEDRKQTLAILRFIAITNSGSDSRQLGYGLLECEGARYAEILGEIPSKPTRIRTFNLRV